MFSYGVYVFHFPIIVLLGDPYEINFARLTEDSSAQFPTFRHVFWDVFLFALTVGLGYFSFLYMEVPLLKISRVTKPWKTLLTGVFAMAVSILIIQLATKDLDPMMTVDIEELSAIEIEKDYATEIDRGEHVTSDECTPVRITIIGESVGNRIGIYWTADTNEDMVANVTEDSFLCPPVARNYAYFTTAAIAYFVCFINDERIEPYWFCDDFYSTKPEKIMKSFNESKPTAVAIHDMHFALRTIDDRDQVVLDTLFDKILAFNMMVLHGMENDVENFYYLNQSPKFWKKNFQESYAKELNVFMNVMDALACSDDGDKEVQMRVSVVDWARLICPLIYIVDFKCDKRVHGFKDIMPDGMHPFGDAGQFLSRQTLAAVMADIARYEKLKQSNTILSWEDAFNIPFNKHLLSLSPPDGEPPLDDLVYSYVVCPYKDVMKLKKAYDVMTFPVYETFPGMKYDSHDGDD
jgi:hypothetical protein